MKKQQTGIRRGVAFLLAVLMALSLLPISALADGWETHPEKATGYHFYYTGAFESPKGDLGEFVPREGSKAPASISKYTLADNQKQYASIQTYCSDFETAPVASDGLQKNLLYKRIPMENVDVNQGLFTGSSAEIAAKTAKLRAILVNSDLMTSLEQMQENSGIATLTADQAMAGTQIAIWRLVNGVESSRNGAYADENVRAYAAWLLNLPGLGPDTMANINIKGVNKETTGGGQYQAVIAYKVEGIGLTINSASVEIEMTYTIAGKTSKVPTENIEHLAQTDGKNGTITVSGIPQGATIDFTLSSEQDNVRSVYIFEPQGGRKASQTLVGIVTDTVPLKTTGEVSSPSDLGAIRIVKDWTGANGSVLPNAVAATHKATFCFTYVDGGFAGVQVIDDVTITGNGYFESGDVFEVGRMYQVEETYADKDKLTDQVKYFKMVKSGGSVNCVWTDKDGNPLPNGGSNRFVNSLEVTTGSLKLTKTVTTVDGVAIPDEAFTFAISRNGVAYKGENYKVFTVGDDVNFTNATTTEDGKFTLKHNQYALFENIPAGDTMTVTEQPQANQPDRYRMDTAVKTAVIAQDTQASFTVENVLKTGTLTVTKTIAAGSVLDMSDFSALYPLTIKVTGENGFEKLVQLYEGKTTETFSVPAGRYLVEELNPNKAGFFLATTYHNGSAESGSVVVGENESKTVTVTNHFRKLEGSLTVSKQVVTEPGVDIKADETFTFELKKGSTPVSGAEYTVGTTPGKTNASGEFTLKAGENASFAKLDPDTYTVTEKDAAITGYKLVTSANPADGSVTVVDGASVGVTYTNTYSIPKGKLKVTKSLTGDAEAELSRELFRFKLYQADGTQVKGHPGMNAETGVFTLADEGEITFSGLLTGSYYVVEDTSGIAQIRHTLTVTGDGADDAATVTMDTTTNIEVKNDYRYVMGSVQFKKLVDGVDGKDAKFTITHDAPGGTVTCQKSGEGDWLTLTSGSSLTLASKDEIVITAPVGTQITVTETENPYYTQSADGVTGWTVTNLTGTATVATGDAPLLTFTNVRGVTGCLEFTKCLRDGMQWSQIPNGGITFTLTGPAGWLDADGIVLPVNGTRNGDSFTFVVTNSNKLIFNKLPAGTYTFKEQVDTAQVPGYKHEAWALSSKEPIAVKVSEKSIELKNNATGSITFENHYERKVGGIGFEKVPDFPLVGEKFSFEVTFYDTKPESESATPIVIPDGVQVIGTPAEGVSSSREGKVLSFTMTVLAGKTMPTVSITNIPEGTYFKIKETDAEGYHLEDAYIGQVDESGTAKVRMTNDRIEDGTLTVSKAVTGDYDDEIFTFTLTVNEKHYKGSYTVGKDSRELKDGQFTLKAGETAVFTGLPRGAAIYVEETTVAYYETTHTVNGGAVISSGTASATMGTGDSASVTVAFTNERKVPDGALCVTKTLSGTAAEEFKKTDFTFQLKRGDTPVAYWRGGTATDGNGQFTLKGGETASFRGLPAGSYTVTELESGIVLPGTVTWTKPSAQTKTHNGNALTFNFTNEFNYKTGELTVKKTVVFDGKQSWEGADPAAGTYTFTLYRGTVGSGTAVTNWSYNGSASTDEDGKFTIPANGRVTFKGLKNGSYYVVEDETNIAISGYTVNTTDTGAVDVSTDKPASITVTNTYTRETGSLSVTKTVIGGGDTATKKDFTFTLLYSTGKPVTNWNHNGSATTDANGQFTLKHDERADFTGLPIGSYTVIETNADVDGYSVDTTTGDPATVETGGETPIIAVTNTYTRKMGSLTIIKEAAVSDGLSDDPPADTSDWSYSFTLSGPEGFPENETRSITLTKANSTEVLNDLPVGNYTLTEIDPAGKDGYTLITTINGVAGSSATLTVNGATTATVNNTYHPHGARFTIEKERVGISGDELGGTKFRFELQSADGVTLNETIELFDRDWIDTRFLAPGSYRIREDKSTAEVDRFTFTGVSYETQNGEALTPDEDGWVSFTITENEEAEIKIIATNRYVKDGAMLKVTKEADGYAGNDSFVFQIAGEGMRFPKVFTIEGEEEGGSTDDQGRFTLRAGQTAIFSQLDTKRSYTVTELPLDADSNFRFASVRGEEFTFTQDVVEEAVVYDITEGEALATGANGQSFTVALGAKQGDSFPGAHITFVNERLLGNLNITKRVEGALFKDEPFTMFVSFTENGGAVDAAKFTEMLVDGAQPVIENGSVKVAVAKDQTVSITGIPAGVQYTVAESLEENYYKVTASGDEGTIGKPGQQAVEGGEEGQTETVVSTASCTITNTRKTGEILLTKYVRGDKDYTGEVFTVEIAFKSNGLAWTQADIDALQIEGNGSVSGNGDGAVTVTATLGHRDGIRITNIPVGTGYTVTERLTAAQAERYSYVLDGSDGMVNPGLSDGSKLKPERDVIALYNFDIPHDSILVGKLVEATEGSPLFDRLFSFQLSLSKPGANSGYGQKELMERSLEAEQQLDDISKQIEAQTALVAEAEAKMDDEAEAAYLAALEALRAIVDENGDLTDAAREGITTPMMPCPDCNGSGEIAETAPCDNEDCHEGQVEALLDCDVCEGTTKLSCDACEGGTIEGEPCDICAGSGKLDCDVCEEGKVPGSEACATCGGDSLIETGNMLDCTTCDENNQVVDTDKLAELENDMKEAAQATFDANEAVLIQKDIDEAREALEKLIAIKDALNEVLDKLYSGIYVEWDAETGEITKEAELDTIPLKLKASDIYAYQEAADGSQTELSLGSIGLSVDENGYIVTEEDGSIIFNLKHKQFVRIDNLPEGAHYNLNELAPANGPGSEAYLGSTINVNGKENDGRTANGKIAGVYTEPVIETPNDGEEIGETGEPAEPGNTEEIVNTPEVPADTGDKGSGNVILVKNKYDDALGQLAVQKQWVNERTRSAVTVELVKDGVRTGERVTLSAENGWRSVFTGLELGSRYSVVEIDPPAGYNVTYSVDSDGILLSYSNKDSSEITVTNTRPRDNDRDPKDPKDPTRPTDPTDPEEPEIDVPEDPTPLDPFEPTEPTPEEPTPEEPPVELEVEDPEVPLGAMPPVSPVPQTGDDFNLMASLGIMLVSLLGGLALLFGGKRRKDDETH